MPISLWDKTAPPLATAMSLQEDRETEVAIVGGGFTGVSTALHLAEVGVASVVLEAEKFGFGGSGRNAGLVNPGLWLPPQDVIERIGEKPGRRLLSLLGNGPGDVFSLIERFDIECEATRNGTIHAAHAPAGMAELKRRADGWRDVGVSVTLMDRDQTEELVGCRKFHGGLVDSRAGVINPMGYLRGLARAAHDAGAELYSGNRVRSARRSGGRWLLDAGGATVSATTLLIATNAYGDDLWPGLRQTITPIHYFQLATEPLGDRAKHILSDGKGLWTTGSIMFSLRRDAHGRLIIGSMGKIIGGAGGVSERWARHHLARFFSDLGDFKFDKTWHGTIAMTEDHIPRIHRLGDNGYAIIGYNGRGIAPGTVFGRTMAAYLAGGSEDDLPVSITPIRRARTAQISARFYATAFAANQWLRRA